MKLGHSLKYDIDVSNLSDTALQLDNNFFQFFITSPKRYFSKRPSDISFQKLNELMQKRLQTCVVHSSYMLNFCNPPTSSTHMNAIKMLSYDLNDTIKFPCVGAIIHMGKNTKKLKITEEEAFNNFIDGITNVLNQTPNQSTLILETGAGVGTEICYSIEDLGRIRNVLNNEHQRRVGFCLDTCHMHSVGYDMSDVNAVENTLKLIDKHLGWSNIKVVHLNSSKCAFNSRKDRHADISKGTIDMSGLQYFIREIVDHDIPIVTETPTDEISIGQQHQIIKSII